MRTWCYVLQQHYEIIIIIVFYRAATCYHKHNVSVKRQPEDNQEASVIQTLAPYCIHLSALE